MTGFLQQGRPPLILASTSQTRARILESAGLAFIVEAPGLEESAMRQAVSGENALDPHDVAEVLARAKAEAVSDIAQGAFVIGGDQVLAFEGEIVDQAREHGGGALPTARPQRQNPSPAYFGRRGDRRRDGVGPHGHRHADHAEDDACLHRTLSGRRGRKP